MKGWTLSDIERLKFRGMVVDAPATIKKNNVPPIKIDEDELQRQCFSWFSFTYPEYSKRCYHIPNGGKRHIIVAVKLKKQGTISGVWDIFLSVPKNGYCGLYVEIKVGKNDLTDNQVAFKQANDKDYAFEVCYSLDEFKSVMQNYLK